MAARKRNNKTPERSKALRKLRQRCLEKNISVAGLARKIHCSRQAIYLALEKPERFSHVYSNLMEELK
jgi:DNA invertase Pin-like site-specific DNA recombinase